MATTATSSFLQFTRLPIELRQTIWQLTLTPRIVEIKFYTPQETSDQDLPAESPNSADGTASFPNGDLHVGEVTFYSFAALPTSFYVCNDSRQAVLPFYPLCFASETAMARTYFNFQLDTLYIDAGFDPVLFRFFDCLTQSEVLNIRHFAFSDVCVVEWESETDEPRLPSYKIKQILEECPNVKRFQIVKDVQQHLFTLSPNVVEGHRYYEAFNDYAPRSDHQIELYREFPDEIREELALNGYHVWSLHIEEIYDLDESLDRVATLVYGWRHALPAEYV